MLLKFSQLIQNIKKKVHSIRLSGIWGVYMGNGQMPPNWNEERYFINLVSL